MSRSRRVDRNHRPSHLVAFSNACYFPSWSTSDHQSVLVGFISNAMLRNHGPHGAVTTFARSFTEIIETSTAFMWRELKGLPGQGALKERNLIIGSRYGLPYLRSYIAAY